MDFQYDYFIRKAIDELHCKSNNVTQILLSTHCVKYQNDKPIVVNVQYVEEVNHAVVSFELEEVDFYLSLLVNDDDGEVIPYAASQYKISLLTSADKGIEELLSMTVLVPDSWEDRDDSIGDDGEHEDGSALYFEPNPGWGGFAEKMDKMLTYLETDVEGVRRLVAEANAFLHVCNCYHVKYIQNEAMELDKKTMSRLVALGLSVNFENQAEGEYFDMGNGWMG